MSRYTDPRVLDLAERGWGRKAPIRAAIKQIKRAEAAVREAACPPERRRATRLARAGASRG